MWFSKISKRPLAAGVLILYLQPNTIRPTQQLPQSACIGPTPTCCKCHGLSFVFFSLIFSKQRLLNIRKSNCSDSSAVALLSEMKI
jgi:hypothetical protein